MPLSLPIVNAQEATFECTFGRGCEGICCRNGRPSLSPPEQKRIQKILKRVLPLLRPSARTLIEKSGFLSQRMKRGAPMLRVDASWCVFFNKGCVLHTIGAEDGDSFQYKPSQCALFPLEQDEDGSWFIRQWGYNGEKWDLFCLNPHQSKRTATTSLQAEIAYAEKQQRG